MVIRERKPPVGPMQFLQKMLEIRDMNDDAGKCALTAVKQLRLGRSTRLYSEDEYSRDGNTAGTGTIVTALPRKR